VGCVALIDRHGEPEVALLRSVIVPFPPMCTQNGSHTEAKAVSLIETWYKGEAGRPPRIALRTFLQRSNMFKVDLEEKYRKRTIDPTLSTSLRSHLMPKWIWVTEVTNSTDIDKGLVIGHIIQDSASHPRDLRQKGIVAFHMPKELRLYETDGAVRTIDLPHDYAAKRIERNPSGQT
jgi:hypothetical protein